MITTKRSINGWTLRSLTENEWIEIEELFSANSRSRGMIQILRNTKNMLLHVNWYYLPSKNGAYGILMGTAIQSANQKLKHRGYKLISSYSGKHPNRNYFVQIYAKCP
jgi:hypothetical protein